MNEKVCSCEKICRVEYSPKHVNTVSINTVFLNREKLSGLENYFGKDEFDARVDPADVPRMIFGMLWEEGK